MSLLTSSLIFIIGAAIGSFLSVVTYRLKHNKKGIILSRSVCTSCKKPLKWHHLIPIVSWAFLRGKCAYCGKKISVRYVLLEITTALVFLFTFLHWNFIISIPSTVDPTFFTYQIDWKIFEIFLFYVVQFSFLIAIFFYDLMYKEIPDKFSIPAIALAILGGFLFTFPTPFSMLIGAVGISSFFAAQFFLSKGKWVGGGDLRLGFLMGALLGWEKGLLALALSYILGGIIGVILLASKKVTRKTAVPFGPFLIIGLLTALFFGDQIINWYFSLVLI